MGIPARAKNGGLTYITFAYWDWIRHLAKEEGVSLPNRGQRLEVLSAKEARSVASVLWVRADKIRKGLAPRDATLFVREEFKKSPPPVYRPGDDLSWLKASPSFDDPESMEDTADFFDISGGVTLEYESASFPRRKARRGAPTPRTKPRSPRNRPTLGGWSGSLDGYTTP